MIKKKVIFSVISPIVKMRLVPGIIRKARAYSEYSGLTSSIRSTTPVAIKIDEDSGDITANPAIRISKTRTASHFTAEFLPHI